MVKVCSVYSCTNSNRKQICKDGNISFHSFPLKNKPLMKVWYAKLKRKNFKATEHSRICSQHFKAEDFTYQPFTGRRFLKPNAVPTLFVYDKKDTKKRKKTSYEVGLSVECPSTSSSASEINEEPRLKDASVQTEDDVITPLLNLLKEKDREIDTLRNQVYILNKTLSNFRLHRSFQHASSDK